MPTIPPTAFATSEEEVRILHLDALPADAPFTEERVRQLAHEAARLRFTLVRIPVAGIPVYVAAKFSPAIHARQCGLGAVRMAPAESRPALFNTHPADTAQP